MDKVVDDPLQKGKDITFKVADKTSLPSPLKKTPTSTTRNAEQKEVTRDDEDHKDYFFKFIDDHICKPLGSGFEDVFQG
ncbi:hypothetical protein E5676_scaffold487G00570 [Cucumis melo var. makuwa]|uniref:Uncharacterized protein n=1 Tax=Cucumis melo var. makuwa TaxID=1194695 RepID=A0A5D3BIL3_CUCMM|nr:hypothetical protein E6C27_scaffold36G00630 [Cucumis melo var. makuwa]TYJ98028.1 hypothetical protein E5676_scaffold487G00570 [Cucumis melo var. makuwa]